jgi:hypothetical protein
VFVEALAEIVRERSASWLASVPAA